MVESKQLTIEEMQQFVSRMIESKQLTIEEMQQFVDKVSSKKVTVKKVPNEQLAPFVGLATVISDDEGTIEIAEDLYTTLSGKKVSNIFIRGFLLHELGHLHIKPPKAQYLCEYEAHMWAISKAVELKYAKVEASLREEILNWSKMEHTEHYLKFRRASEIYINVHGYRF